jgi:multidrug efflux system membrane fusion protein
MAAVFCASERGGNGVGLMPSSRHIIAPVIASLLMLTACSGDPSARADAKAARTSEAVPIGVAIVVTKSVPVQVLANGTVQAIATVTINSQADGQISAIHFTEGQDVKQGDRLFTLDRRPFEATLRQAQANLARDTAQHQQAEAALAQARAAERQAQANLTRDMAQLDNANAEVRRYKSLIDDGAISQEQYDQVRTAALAMEATVEADRAAITNATAVIGAAQATVENAKAAIRQTKRSSRTPALNSATRPLTRP